MNLVTITLEDGIVMRFVPVEAYTGPIGAEDPLDHEERDLSTCDTAYLDAFWMQETPMTVGHAAALGFRPREQLTELGPLAHVTWQESVMLSQAVSRLAHDQGAPGTAGLPTEMQWEVAASAWRGPSYLEQHPEVALREGWLKENSDLRVHPVGTRAPSPLGLFDMMGSVLVWCRDALVPYPSGPRRNWVGMSQASHIPGFRAIRGCGYGTSVEERGALRTNSRMFARETARAPHIGMRLVLNR